MRIDDKQEEKKIARPQPQQTRRRRRQAGGGGEARRSKKHKNKFLLLRQRKQEDAATKNIMLLFSPFDLHDDASSSCAFLGIHHHGQLTPLLTRALPMIRRDFMISHHHHLLLPPLPVTHYLMYRILQYQAYTAHPQWPM